MHIIFCRCRRRYLTILFTGVLVFGLLKISGTFLIGNTFWSGYSQIINDPLGNEDIVNFEEFDWTRKVMVNETDKEYSKKYNSSKNQRENDEGPVPNAEHIDSNHKNSKVNLDTKDNTGKKQQNQTSTFKEQTSNSEPDYQIVKVESGSNKCEAQIYKNQTWQAPYKLYIYELPSEFNVNLIRCMNLPELEYCGFGPILYEERGDVTYHNTWQFALDVILHHKLMFSPYRTHNPQEADVFFIPFYEASHCFCKRHYNTSYKGKPLEEALFNEIQRLPYYDQGKLHLLPVAKIEREEMSPNCPLLMYEWTWNVTVIGIEARDSYRHPVQGHRQFKHHPLPPFITAPYPSYGHFQHPDGGKYHQTIFSSPRRVFVFLASSSRRSNSFRNKILDMFQNMTSVSIDEYYRAKQLSANQSLRCMRLDTPEGVGAHQVPTMQWMKNSVFCLQPAGDSPTRKSFFDGIISGCIPVLFKLDYQPVVTYPFQDVIDYSKFTVTVPTNLTFWDVLEPYEKDPTKVVELQKQLYKVLPWMQYSYPVDNKPHTDAVHIILDEVGKTLSRQRNKTSK